MARINNFRYFTIFIICLWVTKAEKDFQFENASSSSSSSSTSAQMISTWTESHEESKKSITQKNIYSKEMSQCPYSETKIMLSLVLKSYDWNDIPKNKKTRALNKISRFFAIPKEYIKLDSTSKRDIYEMTKRSIKRGINNVENSNSLGKVEFMIGCGQTYFIIGEPISNQIGHQMKDGSIDDIIGLNFGWWVIWRKKINNRVQRFRRHAEGSGDAEDYDEYDEYDEDDEQVTDLPVTTTHAHRHHHGVKPPPSYTTDTSNNTKFNNNKQKFDKNNQKILTIDTNNVKFGTNTNTNTKYLKNDVKSLDRNLLIRNENSSQLLSFNNTNTNENINYKSNKNYNMNNNDNNDDIDEDIVKSVSKLESDITKTIENTKRFKELQLETIKNEMLKKDTINNLPSPLSSSSSNDNNQNQNQNQNKQHSIQFGANHNHYYKNNNKYSNLNQNFNQNYKNKPNDDDYIIEDIATDVQTDITPITSITSVHLNSTLKTINPPFNKLNNRYSNLNLNLNTNTNNSNNDNHNRNSNINNKSTSTQKVVNLEQTTQQLSTVPSSSSLSSSSSSTSVLIKKNRDDTTLMSFTEDSIINNTQKKTATTTTTTSSSSSSPPPPSKFITNNPNPTIINPILTTPTTSTSLTSFTTNSNTNTLNTNTLKPTTTTTTTSTIATSISTTKTTTATTITQKTTTTTTPDIPPTIPTTTTVTVETSEPTSMLSSVLTKKSEFEPENRTITPRILTSSATENIVRLSQAQEEEIEGEATTVLPDVMETTVARAVETVQPSTTTTTTTTQSVTSYMSPVSTTTLAPVTSTSTTATTTTTTTTPRMTTTTTTAVIPTTEYIEPEPINNPPRRKNRLPKQPVTAGKPFSFTVPFDTFYDEEDKYNLTLELLDKDGHPLKSNSWIQFDAEKREIYGLPLEDAVSRWQYKLTATDSKNESVEEVLDITVQQHKGHRSVNHEITMIVKLDHKFERFIDWQIRLIRGITETLNDKTLSNIVVREIRQNQGDTATFIYTNETLPKDKCPEEKLDELVKLLDPKKLTHSLYPDLTVKNVTANPVGPCIKPQAPKTKPTPNMTKNYPPVPRNQVDRVNATIGQLLVYKVPSDTFYDHEDNTELKLSLLTSNRDEIKPTHWLQFDSKNQEFYGVPKAADVGTEEYLLVAEDSGGLTANDALLVVVNYPPKRDYSILFKMILGISYDEFNKAGMQRKFVERLAQLFGDQTTSNIQIRSIHPLNDTGNIMINFHNTTVLKTNDGVCPDDEIEIFRRVYFHQGYNLIREKVKKTIGSEFHVLNITIVPLVSCHATIHNTPHEIIPIKTEDKKSSSFADDYLLTFILPAVIILAMLLLASIIACVLHRRRLTGKMELGDEEERRSFRSKGIPVIFQDELDEKPEIGNKSPIILKDEKPPLLPPSYNSTNLDGDNDVDEYVPPPAVVIGGREVRGKSPVTPSYRKPPPYVSP